MAQVQLSSVEAGQTLVTQLLESVQGAGGVFPLSYVQESLWLVEQMAPGTSAYNLPEGWRLTGRLNLPALQWSLDEIVRRHETLRTMFSPNDGQPAQTVLAPQAFALPIVDLSQHADREAELQRLVAAEARRPFDLTHAPLARALLFRLGAEEHVLVVNMHHIISDAWSQGVFMRELAELYRARATGQASPLRELPIQYADFAVWQREMLEGQALQAQLEYWKEKLRSPLPALVLPADHARPAMQSHRGSTQFFTLPGPLTEGLKELSRRRGVTLFMTLLAAFKTLLHRYTRQDDIVVGAPVAGRERVETEGLIGFFVNTHALRTDLSGDPAFTELLGRVREVVLGACAHQEAPLDKLVNALQPERDPSRHPLFQVVFGLQTAAPDKWSLPELEATRIELDNGAAKFDWTLLLTETSQGLSVRSEYCTDLFEPGTMMRFIHQFQVLLEGILAAPAKRLSELPLLTGAERQQLLEGWNRTGTAYERNQCIHELFEAQAAKAPEAIALVFEGRQMTYGELNRRANQLACRLRACGVGPDVLVGLCLERSLEMIVAMLAILKAGGAYVPLDRTYPKERLAFMLEDTAAPVLVIDRLFETQNLPVKPDQVIRIDTEQAELASECAENARSAATADHLAYVIYTSGSTGTPKGAEIPHRGVVRLVRNTNYLEFGPGEVFLQLAPISFDASTFEIWGALLNGAKLVIFPPHIPSLEELGRTIAQEKITTLWLTAGLFHQMVDQHLESLRGVRRLLAGGDTLSVAHVLKAVRGLSGCQLINGYGPTENTTFTCCYRIPPSWPGRQSVPIGRPLSNTQVYVLDQQLEPTPIGVPGELYTGGDGLARGYLNRPELTVQRFIPNPLRNGAQPGLLYRTGDLARWLPDGNLEFLGRVDEQLKIRGYRVEPGEVETVLVQHPAIGEAIVVAREDKSGTKHLVAYVVPWAGKQVADAELREFLEAKLPPHMVPTHFVQMEALPLTSNGKVDRRALPAPDLAAAASPEGSVAPRNPTETLLAGIWCEVLGCKTVGIHQNFFHLGGHSLLATQVISRIVRALNVELPVRAIFEAPTIARLAEAVARAQPGLSSSPPIVARRAQAAKAAELLARLGQLSDAEVETLLGSAELKSHE